MQRPSGGSMRMVAALLFTVLSSCDEGKDDLDLAEEALVEGDRRAWLRHVTAAVASLESRSASLPPTEGADDRIRHSRLERSIRVARANLQRIAADTDESWRSDAGDFSDSVCALAHDASDLERRNE